MCLVSVRSGERLDTGGAIPTSQPGLLSRVLTRGLTGSSRENQARFVLDF